jgi:4-diphosphocytidyl-2-C-methyl-D-erythritol kinase
MILKSCSKINLSLKINKKLASGLHNIQSFFCLINLHDRIKIKKIKEKRDIIKFRGKFAKYVSKKKNTIFDTLRILRKANTINSYYSVEINKKIPVFAGLGGGTSNAASLIKYLTEKKIKKKLASELEKKIGTDLKIFDHNQGFLKNIKTINDFKKKYSLFFLLIYPNFKSSTKYVYSKVRKYSKNFNYNFSKLNNKKRLIKVLINNGNDLQSIVEKKHPIIEKLITEIQLHKGCYFSRMTGSGSVCYGMFKNEKAAKVALTKIKLKYPKFWFSVAKTI